jgi:hypothetical protein
MVRMGVVGHRWFADVTTSAFVASRCHELLRGVHDDARSVVALSALAAGSDTLFAQAAVGLGIPLVAVRPFDRYADDFATAGERRAYGELWSRADRRVRLPYPSRSDEAYRAAMRWVAERSDVLLAIWDGRPSTRAGGTADTVAHARALGRAVLHVDPARRRVMVHGG